MPSPAQYGEDDDEDTVAAKLSPWRQLTEASLRLHEGEHCSIPSEHDVKQQISDLPDAMQRLALLTHHQLTRAREEKEKEEKEKEKEEKEKEKEGKEKKEKRLSEIFLKRARVLGFLVH